MKKISLVVGLGMVLFIFSVGSVFAYPVSSSDTVYLTAATTDSSVSGMNIGNYSVYAEPTGGSQFSYAFETFCVEKNVHYYPGSNHEYTVTITKDIQSSGDTLAAGTKYLYWNFYNGSLNSLRSYNGTSADVSALQDAIWTFQGYEIGVTEENNRFYSLAKDIDFADVTGMDVMVMNLWGYNGTADSNDAQSQLIANAPVPEPATLILLGSGLAGLAFYRRKRK